MAGAGRNILDKQHYNVMLDFMEEHPELAKGQFVGPMGRSRLKELWKQLTNELNGLGLGYKEQHKWQKVGNFNNKLNHINAIKYLKYYLFHAIKCMLLLLPS